MMLNPAGRSSRWRYDSSAPTNYDDNSLYCGGLWVRLTQERSLTTLFNDASDTLETNRKWWKLWTLWR